MTTLPSSQAIETNQIPAFTPSDILANFPEPFYSHNPSSFVMTLARAVLAVSDSVLSNSLSQYALNSYWSIPANVLNAYFTSLFGIASDLSPTSISLILRGVQAGFTAEGVQLIARGAMGTEVKIVRSEPSTVTVYPLLPTSARGRYMFMRVVENIKWAGSVVQIGYPKKPYSRDFTAPLALSASSQYATTVENALEASIAESDTATL